MGELSLSNKSLTNVVFLVVELDVRGSIGSVAPRIMTFFAPSAMDLVGNFL